MRDSGIGSLPSLLLAVLVAAVSVGHAKAKSFTLTETNYQITFPDGWDTLLTSSILGKYQGVGGVAVLSCQAGNTVTEPAALMKDYGDSLGGHFTLGRDSALTLGTYSAHWQEFAYDSLPKLSARIYSETQIPVSFKNGTIRTYYLVSGGFVFSATEMSMASGGSASLPNADVEAAIKTLKLGSQTGIREIAGAWGGAEMWIHDGRLGGAWFAAHNPLSIDCFNLSGAWIGAAKPSGTPGIWTLPAVDRNAFLRIQLPDGSRFHLATRN